jgi:hypothetical protein
LRRFSTIEDIRDPAVRAKFASYPPAILTKLLRLRRLIKPVAAQGSNPRRFCD